MCKPHKCSTVSINHASSEMSDLSQLIVIAFVIVILAPHIASTVQCEIFKYIGVL